MKPQAHAARRTPHATAARSAAARSGGARSGGARSGGARSGGARSGGARSGGARSGGDRTRTDDPLLAKQVLSQLSYAPAQWPTTNDQRSPLRAHWSVLTGPCAWAREDLNLRPHAYQACALTN